MKLLIDIDEKLYKSVVEHTKTGYIGSDVWLAVANGKPYNSSGDLISRDDLKEAFDTAFFNDEDDYKKALRIINDAPTVMKKTK